MEFNTLNKLPYDQRTALLGELSLHLYNAISNSDIVYRVYCIIKNVKDKDRELYTEALASLTHLPDEVFQRILVEIQCDTLPRWIWFDKVMEDLRDSLTHANSYKAKEGSVKNSYIDLTECQINVIKSAFTMFIRRAALTNPLCTYELCEKIIKEGGVYEPLIPTCLMILMEIKNLKEDDLIVQQESDILHVHFNIKDIMYFDTERRVYNKGLKGAPKPKNSNKTQRERKTKSPNKKYKSYYVVEKVFRENTNSTQTLKTFENEEDAEKYVQYITDKYPELLQSCFFVVTALEIEISN